MPLNVSCMSTEFFYKLKLQQRAYPRVKKAKQVPYHPHEQLCGTPTLKIHSSRLREVHPLLLLHHSPQVLLLDLLWRCLTFLPA